VVGDANELAVGLTMVYAKGAARIAFCQKLGLWCFLSDMWPNDIHVYKMKHMREAAGTSPWRSGPHLLYVSSDTSPTGKWFAALAEEPAPCIRALVMSNPVPPIPGSSAPRPCSVGFFSFPWQQGSHMVFRHLLDFGQVDWRGFKGHRGMKGPSAAEIAMRLVDLVRQSICLRAVCTAFLPAVAAVVAVWPKSLRRLLQVDGHHYLLPVPRPTLHTDFARTGNDPSFIRRIERQAFISSRGLKVLSKETLLHITSMLKPLELAFLERTSRLHASIPGPALRAAVAIGQAHADVESLVRVLRQTQDSWQFPFAITKTPEFEGRAWGCSVSSVDVSTTVKRECGFNCEERSALDKAFPALIAYAREILEDVPVCWDREAMANRIRTTTNRDDGAVIKQVFSGNLLSTPPPLRACAQLKVTDRGLTLLDNSSLVNRHRSAMKTLRSCLAGFGGGATADLANCTHGWRSETRDPGQRTCQRCALVGDDGSSVCAECQDARGWSLLHATLTFEFDLLRIPTGRETDAPRRDLRVDLSVCAFVIPFFCTSKDVEITLPFSESSEDDDDGEGSGEEDDEEDEAYIDEGSGEDAEDEGAEEGEEEADEEADEAEAEEEEEAEEEMDEGE